MRKRKQYKTLVNSPLVSSTWIDKKPTLNHMKIGNMKTGWRQYTYTIIDVHCHKGQASCRPHAFDIY